eukprot:gene53323-65127_t
MGMSREICWSELDWVDLEVATSELRPENTMNMGQCFNWRAIDSYSKQTKLTWVGVLNGRPYAVRQTLSTTLVADLSAPSDREETKNLVQKFHQYFQTDSQLSSLYEIWSKECSRMRTITQCLPGSDNVKVMYDYEKAG